MSLRQRVGQLLMVDCPSTGVSTATTTALRQSAVGSVILDGTTTSGAAAVRNVTSSLNALASGPAGLFIATDQEGGEVQRLQGPGLSQIPSAVTQGGLAPDALRHDAAQWGRELRAAGVNVDLAPVLDTVPVGSGSNPPIGDLDRQYGATPESVRDHGLAYAAGMADAGVDATAKHFPGLGRVRGNTDTTSGVRDDVTTRDGADLTPFRAAVKQGVPFVMISSAIYARIDPARPAVFSPIVIEGMLRHDLGFRGVVISDDIGAATQLSGISPGDRAVRFVQAGGDIVLTVVASLAAPMTAALIAKARSDPAFEREVDAAALRVLEAKRVRGLLG